MPLKWIDIKDQTGRTSSLEYSSPEALEVIGGIRHCDKIQPKEVADARKMIEWLNEWIKLQKKVEPELIRETEIWWARFDPDKHICPPDMKVFSYTGHHVPTGIDYPLQGVFYNRNDFETLLRKWSLTKMWTYTEN